MEVKYFPWKFSIQGWKIFHVRSVFKCEYFLYKISIQDEIFELFSLIKGQIFSLYKQHSWIKYFK